MSQENVEVVRQGYEAFNCGDWDAAGHDLHLDCGLLRGLEATGDAGGLSK
jgi:hypothetical protein